MGMGFFKKKEKKEDLFEKKTVVKNSNEEKKQNLKKVVKKNVKTIETQRKSNQNIEKRITDVTKIPENATILSDTKESVYFIKDENKKHGLVLNLYYAINGMGEKQNCIMLIMNRSQRTTIPYDEIKKAAEADNKKFVFLMKENDNAAAFIDEVKRSIEKKKNKNKDLATDGSALQKRVLRLFQDAEENGASDIHIEAGGGQSKIRARINGNISLFDAFVEGAISSQDTGEEFARTIYNTMATVSDNSFNPRFTQDALIEANLPNGKKLRIRVATAPTEPSGFDMVMRLLVIQDSAKPLTLTQLGYQNKLRNDIESAIAQGVGVTIVAGTTGSGKSTTLQNILMGEINNRNGKIKVITVEDPPEYFIPGASQIPVKKDGDGDVKKAFKAAIKAAMRMDPDVIMIGEVRDEDSAKLLIEAVQTGHKVLSTIHAASALSIIPRLENLGINREVLSDNEFISGLIYQKLFPILCPHCSVPLKDGFIPVKRPLENILKDNNFATEESINLAKKEYPNVNIARALQDMNIITIEEAEDAMKIFKDLNNEEDNEKLLKRITSIVGNINDCDIRFMGNGCSQCKKGIKGRTVVAEVVKPDMEMRELISSGNQMSLYKYWRKNLGGKTAKEDAYDKMRQGLLSPIDIEDTFGFMEINN